MTDFSLKYCEAPHGLMAWRGAGPESRQTLVLLHGIGSGAASWSGAIARLAASQRVIAWDAPGYGRSAALPNPEPMADDYAQALEALLRATVRGPVVLVGHSLGALMAAATAARGNVDVRALVLASPAPGYGQAPEALRKAKHAERLKAVDTLGIDGMAAARSAALCAPGTPEDVIEQVRHNMRLCTPVGYRQAAWMLAHEDLRTHLRRLTTAAAVICGALDTVTPPRGAQSLAAEFTMPYLEIPAVAHALYVEAPGPFAEALESALAALAPAANPA